MKEKLSSVTTAAPSNRRNHTIIYPCSIIKIIDQLFLTTLDHLSSHKISGRARRTSHDSIGKLHGSNCHADKYEIFSPKIYSIMNIGAGGLIIRICNVIVVTPLQKDEFLFYFIFYTRIERGELRKIRILFRFGRSPTRYYCITKS